MNKIALITGGSRGLGRAGALALAAEGCDIVITYHSNEQAANSLVNEVEWAGQRALALQLDTADMDSFAPFVANLTHQLTNKFGRSTIDYLVNNAGVGINALFADTTLEQVDTLLNMHVKGPYFLSQSLLPVIANGGAILNVSSGLSRFCFPGYSAYGMAKGAVEVMTRYMAKELGPRKIRVNTLAPGAIETDFRGGEVRDNHGLNQAIASQTALGRVGLPDDIGGAIAILLSDKSYWINGQRVEASGGMML
ncbi:SDR family oxidoreductase [Aestuariibacter sp. GS-14]|uniref:SDR family NAD(P)-dependent oxidoreductase n=1 Tax=Aestuariibacter sp. GS-14 TaxID=2590670 RepID=UPI001129C2D7|nr:SDR family oxidoreductase [Aestuariibacter sp. GS-14]TPV56862.1 SDR family oxidoreductase [Aestuariibacter sp. GS-14]